MTTKKNVNKNKLVKVVYFDEESASDLLDMAFGGKSEITEERKKDYAGELEVKAGARAAAKFNWLPFFGGSAEAGVTASSSVLGRNILNKTLSNTILTDYLIEQPEMQGVVRLDGVLVSAKEGSAAHAKMFSPYTAMFKSDELPFNIAEMDSTLASAKGYYEMLGIDGTEKKSILRFNLRAFRNNYGLADLGRMNLVFHGVKVGNALESSLSMEAEFATPSKKETRPLSPREALGETDNDASGAPEPLLDVYDVLLAGVIHGE